MVERSTREILRAVRRIEIATRRAVNADLAGRYHSVFKGQGMAFSEVRPYAPGDDVRHIDWNVSARHQEHGLFVKQFIEERELTVMLLVDMSGSTDFGTRGERKRELLAKAGALVAYSAIRNNDRVGLILFTDEVELYLPPRKGKQHVLRVTREIATHEPRARRTRLGAALGYLSRVQKKKTVCFVLSDWLDPQGWDKQMKLAAARHDVVAVRVTDAAELRLPNLGIVDLIDAETGKVRRIDTGQASGRAAFQKAQSAHRDATKKRLRQLGCDLVDIPSYGPEGQLVTSIDGGPDLVTPLVNFFRARSARMRSGR